MQFEYLFYINHKCLKLFLKKELFLVIFGTSQVDYYWFGRNFKVSYNGAKWKGWLQKSENRSPRSAVNTYSWNVHAAP